MTTLSLTIESRRAPIRPPVVVALPGIGERVVENSALLPVFTFILWLGCAGVGLLGFVIPYARPQPASKAANPVQAELIHVELTSESQPLPNTVPPPPPDVAQPPPLLQPVVPPQAPPMIAVAEPSPAVAFALPVAAPAQIVDVKQASPARVEAPAIPVAAAPAPRVQPLTFGTGEGRQPAPEYPRQAMRSGQEGTVVVRFSVGEDGRVLAAEAATPSPWRMLNDSAVRVVRERWRFRAGPVRLFEVAIRFELSK